MEGVGVLALLCLISFSEIGAVPMANIRMKSQLTQLRF